MKLHLKAAIAGINSWKMQKYLYLRCVTIKLAPVAPIYFQGKGYDCVIRSYTVHTHIVDIAFLPHSIKKSKDSGKTFVKQWSTYTHTHTHSGSQKTNKHRTYTRTLTI